MVSTAFNVPHPSIGYHKWRHAKASRLHRDVSLANIVVTREPGRFIRRGYLIDWDASCRTDEGETTHTARRYGVATLVCQSLLLPSLAFTRERARGPRTSDQDDFPSIGNFTLTAGRGDKERS